MQLTYVFSELGNGLRRNVSMTVAVVVTLFVSLTLVGLGLLLNAQADKAEKFWGDRLQITVFLCTDNSPRAACIDGKTTRAQKAAVVKVLRASDEVKSFRFENSRTAYAKWRELQTGNDDSQQQVLDSIRPKDLPESYWVTLKDPRKFRELRAQVGSMDGVGTVRDLREILQPIYFWITAFKWGAIGIAAVLLFAAILQVGNTIRLAAYARRKEIGIMRLVGASSLYIQLPFLLESLVAAVLGVALAGGAVFGFLYLVVYRVLRPNSSIVAWVDYSDGVVALVAMTLVGLLLTLVPTLLLTRRYLRV
ncbi:permease-like cell division protein FtsX [Nocardioides marmoribigeumensis]|uniref:Cell division protein FtsX n=1 Tax=Nocardioides marmoribigeumensis TaxID=433649 RepID=A0ABU2C097_9ACTN|nr:permease-like cell division protein FtsX [Nocardioides marmoribigeumensis]MDR7364086.1 cell division transport system permease protein [Nocardioides marmoribigeumensis]